MAEIRKPAISIDFKNGNRIRIHKITLHLLGDPKYIQLLVNPNTQTIAIRRGHRDDICSHKIYPIKTKSCFELHSLELMTSLRQLYKNWNDGSSYRIYGKMDPKNEIAQFQIADMKELNS